MFSNFNVGHNKLKMQINKEIIVNNPNSILPYNVADIKRRGIRVINNVYQPKYKFGIASTGLGDFIRGSYFILDFCFKYKFKPKIIFNNCISKFLKIKTNGLNKINYLLKYYE